MKVDIGPTNVGQRKFNIKIDPKPSEKVFTMLTPGACDKLVCKISAK